MKSRKRGSRAPGSSGTAPQTDGPRNLYSLAEGETFALGQALGRTLKGGEMILLFGELGAGKTVFARGIASALGIDPNEVGSPTFILVDRHIGRLTLYHADLYRLDRQEEVLELGLEEVAALGAAVVVEWGEKLPAELREGAIEVRLTDLGDDTRRITFGASS